MLIAPFVTGVFGGDAEELSLAACFPSLAGLEARGGLLRGAAATKVEAVFSRMQGAATAKRGHRILAPKGGLEALVRALGKELEARISYNTTIASLERSEGELTLHAADGSHHHFDAIVLATPAPVSAALVNPHHAPMAAALRGIPYAPMAVVGVGFSERVGNPLDGFGFLVAKGESPRILGAAYESSVWSGRAPEGGTLVRCLLGGARDPNILDSTDEEILEIALRDLKSTVGIDETPSFTKVIRWPRAIPQYTIGHRKRVAEVEAGARDLGLVVAGNATGGVSVNDCIAKAARVVKSVAERLAASAGALLLLVLVSGVMIACGASNKGAGAPHDAGYAEGPQEPADAAFIAEPSLPADRGKIEVMARWLWPPAALRRSPGRNSCGVARRAPLHVELMGGLSHTAVTTAAGEAPGPAKISTSECRLEPPLVVLGVGQKLHLVSKSEAGHTVVVEELDASGAVSNRLGTMPMRIAGQEFAIAPEREGVLRLHLSSDPEDFAYALVSKGSAVVTSIRGMAELELPVGSHAVQVWHPPVGANAAAVRSELTATIQAQIRTKHIVDMKR